MNSVGSLVCLFMIVFSPSVCANEKKWFPIKPINLDETSSADTNKSKLQSGSKIIHNIAVIKNLLDRVNKDGLNSDEGKKSWYSFEPEQNE